LITGITGGIGGGKSTLAVKLREAGYSVYDSDGAARQLQNENEEIRAAIIALFGNEAYKHGGLNRTYIAGIVFKKPDLLQKLNQIVHPAVRNDFTAWCKLHESEPLVFLESALLLGSELRNIVDKIVLVTAPVELRIQRVMHRSGLSREQVVLRMKNQLSEAEMIAQADVVVDTHLADLKTMNIKDILLLIK